MLEGHAFAARGGHTSLEDQATVLTSRARTTVLGVLLALGVAFAGRVAAAETGEVEILSALQDYFDAADPAQRSRLVATIEAHPAFDRSRLSDWLHRLDLHPELKPGRTTFKLDVGFGQRRQVTLRIPRGYTPRRTWPLIYALHPSGGNGRSYLREVERLLGERREEFIIAAPTHYRQTVLDAPPPFTLEHPLLLRELRRRVHLDSDRIYVLGLSLGGYASWTLALLHADEFAGAVPMASTFSAPIDVDGLWVQMTPNLAHVPILHVWGEQDRLPVPGLGGRRPTGTMSDLNRVFSGLLRDLNLENVVDHPVPKAGHGYLGGESLGPVGGPHQAQQTRKLVRGRRSGHSAFAGTA